LQLSENFEGGDISTFDYDEKSWGAVAPAGIAASLRALLQATNTNVMLSNVKALMRLNGLFRILIFLTS